MRLTRSFIDLPWRPAVLSRLAKYSPCRLDALSSSRESHVHNPCYAVLSPSVTQFLVLGWFGIRRLRSTICLLRAGRRRRKRLFGAGTDRCWQLLRLLGRLRLRRFCGIQPGLNSFQILAQSGNELIESRMHFLLVQVRFLQLDIGEVEEEARDC